MYIFNVFRSKKIPGNPALFNHARVCDPVIAEDKLRLRYTAGWKASARVFLNELDVLDISNLSAPVFGEKNFDMTNPHGLSKDGRTCLFICDGRDGLKNL